MRESLFFVGERKVEVREVDLPALLPGQVQVKTIASAISAGTEMLLYRNEMPADMPLDETIPGMAKTAQYPIQYGYATVGRVVELSPGVDKLWRDRLVFAFHPHQSCFNAGIEQLQPVPPNITPEEAIFLPNMETAVSLVMAGNPTIGERVIIFGQGVVGWLLLGLLSRFPLAQLTVVDKLSERLDKSVAFVEKGVDFVGKMPAEIGQEDADLCFEIAGNPAALNQAIAAAGYGGRVVVGSWYGNKLAALDLGSHFHRNHIQLISNQVSRLPPKALARWSKARRFEVAWEMIRALKPARLISHRFALQDAPAAYKLLDQQPEQAGQIIFE